MLLPDSEIIRRINSLRRSVGAWLHRHEFPEQGSLKTFEEHFNDEPEEVPIVLVLTFDEDLYWVFNGRDEHGLIEALSQVAQDAGFAWEKYDGTTVNFYPLSDHESYYSYFRFQWLCSLIQPGIVDVTAEVFQQFKNAPEKLKRISPRSLEVLLDGAFRSIGFRTELGPGTGDGGVDLRLYQHDAIAELQTLVQVKRYAAKHPIRLDAVAALLAMVGDGRANRGLFVTTSRYLPGVRKFAARHKHVLRLADTSDMEKWCTQAEGAVKAATDLSWVESVLARAQEGRSDQPGLVGKIVHATWGYDMLINDFCMVVRDTPGAVLLAPLQTRHIISDHGQVGQEVPEYRLETEEAHRAILGRKQGDARVTIWARRRLYSVWDGKPKHFNYMN